MSYYEQLTDEEMQAVAAALTEASRELGRRAIDRIDLHHPDANKVRDGLLEAMSRHVLACRPAPYRVDTSKAPETPLWAHAADSSKVHVHRAASDERVVGKHGLDFDGNPPT